MFRSQLLKKFLFRSLLTQQRYNINSTIKNNLRVFSSSSSSAITSSNNFTISGKTKYQGVDVKTAYIASQLISSRELV